MDNGLSVGPMLTKGMRVKAHWFQANDPPSSLAGMQMKLGVTERFVEGEVVKISSTSPTELVDVRVHVKPDEGDVVLVKPNHIVEIVSAPVVAYEERKPENKITNTTKQIQENPMLGLVGAMDAHARGNPEAFITGMEAQGQRELVSQTSRLPAEGSNDPAWKEMGVVFGAAVAGDALFRSVELPAGWKLQAQADHDMWSSLLDDQGRVRGKMFYKAAFYDRRANIRPSTRYVKDQEYKVPDSYDGERRAVVKDTATDKVLFATAWVPGYAELEKLWPEVDAWLKENRPDWKNAAAYWGWD